MKIIKELTCLKEGSQGMQDLLKKWMQQFAEELKHYRCITDVKEEEEKIVVDNHPFILNEVALVSAFSNAIVRNDHYKNITCLQEYGVYNNKNQFQGRADLLIAHNEWNVLIEAKKWEVVDLDKLYNKEVKYFIDGTIQKHLNDVKNNQLKYYAKAEKEYYKNKDTYLMVLVFEELIWPENDSVYLKDVEKYESSINDYFYFLILDTDVPVSEHRGSKRALEVYGLLEKFN